MNDRKRNENARQISMPVFMFLIALSVSMLVFPALAYAAPTAEWAKPAYISQSIGFGYGQDWVIPDGSGNTFVCWSDVTDANKPSAKTKLLLQKVAADGSILWPQSTLLNEYLSGYGGFSEPVLASDGGIVVAWADNRNKRKQDIFAQKVDKDGNRMWAENGIPVYVGPGMQQLQYTVADNAGGMIVIWIDDERPGLYMQRINEQGKPVWEKDGISLYELLNIPVDENWYQNAGTPAVQITGATDGTGSFYVAWSDIKPTMPGMPDEMNPQTGSDGHFFIQRLTIDGTKTWFSPVSIDVKDAYVEWAPGTLFAADNGSVIFQWNIPEGSPTIWQPSQGGGYSGNPNPNQDFFATKITADGKVLWDTSKAIYSKRTKDVNQMNSVMFTSAGQALMLIDQFMVNEERMMPVFGPNGKQRMEKSIIPIGKGFKLVRFGDDGKVSWEKDFNSGNGYILSNRSYWVTSSPTTLSPSASFFLMVNSDYGYASTQIVKTQTIKMRCIDGSIEWWSNIDEVVGMPKSSMQTALVPDNNGGIFFMWREPVLPPDASTTQTVFNPYIMNVANQLSKTYLQHVIDDNSGWADLQKKDWSYSYISELVESKAISGYSSDVFRPNSPVTRAEFAKMTVVSLGLTNKKSNDNSKISDISKHWARSFIEIAVGNGIVKGYPNGTFKPDAKISRAEIAMIISRLDSKDSGNATAFKDVPKDFWAYSAIAAAQGKGLVAGYGDGNFRPNRNTTRAEAAKVISLLNR